MVSIVIEWSATSVQYKVQHAKSSRAQFYPWDLCRLDRNVIYQSTALQCTSSQPITNIIIAINTNIVIITINIIFVIIINHHHNHQNVIYLPVTISGDNLL